MAELFIDRPGQPRRNYLLAKDVVSLGKRNDCDVVLDSPFVSRTHARIEQVDGRYVVFDPGSLNGVTLNGERIEAGKAYELRRSDQVCIADFTLTFWQTDDDAATVPWKGPAPGSLFVDVAAHKVWVGDTEIEALQPIPFKLLAFLYANRGRVCSKEEIGEHVWGAVAVGGHSVAQWDDTLLQQAVHRVRQRIEPPGSTLRFLHNVRPSGYRLDVTPRS